MRTTMTSIDEPAVPLQTLFSRALEGASKAYSLPTIEDETQTYIDAAKADLNLIFVRINHLHLFSTNESLDEVATKDLIYMSVPFILALVELSARATERDERMERLKQAQRFLSSFSYILEAYHVIPDEEKKLYGPPSSSSADPAKRREHKIAQFKKEKDLKSMIAAIRRRRDQPDIDMSNSYDLVRSFLPSTSSDEDGDEEDEDVIRDSVIVLLRLQWAETSNHLNSIVQELELLNAPSQDAMKGERRSGDDTWRLDAPLPNTFASAQGPLLDVSGRPLRPFTILPAGAAAAERARLQAQVFQPDHRLPTMSIDEYLEEEQRRGNIIDGGGPQSQNEPTRKEQLALDMEMDGTLEGEGKAEEKRQEDERWARYTDTHPRGSGNTMNRG